MPTVKYNIKNAQYAVKTNGSYSAEVKSIGLSDSITFEGQYNEKEINGDGQIMFVLASDKGLNSSLNLVTLEDQYEIDMGRKLVLDQGTADVQQIGTQPHAIYYEFDGTDETGANVVMKVWILNVISSKPTEGFNQNSDAPNPVNYTTNLNVLGETIGDGVGGTYKDAKGNTRKAWKIVAAPSDTGYDTFGDSVPTPTKTAAV